MAQVSAQPSYPTRCKLCVEVRCFLRIGRNDPTEPFISLFGLSAYDGSVIMVMVIGYYLLLYDLLRRGCAPGRPHPSGWSLHVTPGHRSYSCMAKYRVCPLEDLTASC